MRRILLTPFLFIFLASNSQTLTQVYHEPKPGDIDIEWRLDTSTFAAGMPVSVTGSAAVWNFTNLATDSLIKITYQSPTAVPSATAYTNCSVVQNDRGAFTFFQSVTTPTAQTEILGMDIVMGSVTLTNTAIAARYPVTYGFNLTDNVAGTFTSSSLNGSCTGSIVTAADGLGTLNLPIGVSFSNVIRIKTTLNLSLFSGVFPVGKIRQVYYYYYHSSHKFPLLSIIYTIVSTTGGPTPKPTGVAIGNADVLVSLPKNKGVHNHEIMMFPNPVTKELNVVSVNEHLKPNGIEVYNALSQMVYKAPFEKVINFESLEKGIYLLVVTTENGQIRKRIVKQ